MNITRRAALRGSLALTVCGSSAAVAAMPSGDLARLVLAYVLETGDLIGHAGDGSAFMLVSLPPGLLNALVEHGAEAEDVEDDDPGEIDDEDRDDEDPPSHRNWPFRLPLGRPSGWEQTPWPGVLHNPGSGEVFVLPRGR